MKTEDRKEVTSAVRSAVSSLQSAHMGGSPQARARIARLRRGLGRDAGAVPNIWEDTIGLVPPHLRGRGDDPSPAEKGVHLAMTLYALHQQGSSKGVHQHGVSLGAAAQRARQSHHSADAFDRRFLSAIGASTFAGVAYHLRALIPIFRQAGTGMDYGLVAANLADLCSPYPDSSRRVRLSWGRDYSSYTSAKTVDPTGQKESA